MKKAFSMIELIFVMVILGILASSMIPKFSAGRQDADIATIKIQIAAIRTGIRDFTTTQIIAGKTKDTLDVADIPSSWDESKNDTIYPFSLEGKDEVEKLFSTVLPNPIKGAKSKNENGWSKFDENGGTTPGRYYVRFGNASVRFDYCSTATNQCSSTTDTPLGQFYCSDDEIKKCSLLDEQKI
ncbi:type II secretion system protein [Campylobacter fetus]|uniref:type II secretion system protein n=1 Tax=Campylobacter fetus TaxID=196 RepID=UPI00073A7C0A|nr:type II secretion system protein [Campylobacter fetus]ALV64890.1 putative type II secretion system protein [Campylobacter fetus subsp. testudinum Sp3]